jgi:hypothetical protein
VTMIFYDENRLLIFNKIRIMYSPMHNRKDKTRKQLGKLLLLLQNINKKNLEQN